MGKCHTQFAAAQGQSVAAVGLSEYSLKVLRALSDRENKSIRSKQMPKRLLDFVNDREKFICSYQHHTVVRTSTFFVNFKFQGTIFFV